MSFEGPETTAVQAQDGGWVRQDGFYCSWCGYKGWVVYYKSGGCCELCDSLWQMRLSCQRLDRGSIPHRQYARQLSSSLWALARQTDLFSHSMRGTERARRAAQPGPYAEAGASRESPVGGSVPLDVECIVEAPPAVTGQRVQHRIPAHNWLLGGNVEGSDSSAISSSRSLANAPSPGLTIPWQAWVRPQVVVARADPGQQQPGDARAAVVPMPTRANEGWERGRQRDMTVFEQTGEPWRPRRDFQET